jgi:hypothetical protein
MQVSFIMWKSSPFTCFKIRILNVISFRSDWKYIFVSFVALWKELLEDFVQRLQLLTEGLLNFVHLVQKQQEGLSILQLTMWPEIASMDQMHVLFIRHSWWAYSPSPWSKSWVERPSENTRAWSKKCFFQNMKRGMSVCHLSSFRKREVAMDCFFLEHLIRTVM